MKLTIAPPPKPSRNAVCLPAHPWARYWTQEALRACQSNEGRYTSPEQATALRKPLTRFCDDATAKGERR